MATHDESMLFEFSDGDVSVWMEPDEPIMLMSVNAHGDPVELTADEARELAQTLISLADAAETE